MLSTQSRSQTGFEAHGNSVASLLFQNGFLIAKLSSHFFHFRIDGTLHPRTDGIENALGGVVTHALNAGIVMLASISVPK